MENSKEQIMELNNKLNEAYSLVMKNDFENAKKQLDEFLEKAKNIEKSENDEYSFRSVIEFILFVNKKKLDKKIIWTAVNYSKAYNLYGYICNEIKSFDEAIRYMDMAIQFNPMDANSYFEKAESYKFKNDFEMMKRSTLDAYDIIYDPKTLARFYRNMGYYYIEMKKYDIAYALYTTSVKYEQNKTANHEMGYINHLLQREPYEMSYNEAFEILKNENIIIGALPENVNILYSIYTDEKLKETDIKTFEHAENLLFGLTRDKAFSPFKEIIDEIGFSILIPKKWQVFDKETMEKNNFKSNTRLAVLTESNAFFQVVVEENCNDFEESYQANILNMENCGLKIVKQTVLEMKNITIKQAVTEYLEQDKSIQILHNFIKYSNLLLDFSITLDSKVDINDEAIFWNQQNSLEIYNILTTLIFKE